MSDGKERGEEKPAERKEVRGCPCRRAGLTELPPPAVRMQWEGRAWRGGGRGRLLSRRDLGGDVRKRASAFKGLCLPTGTGSQVLSANSLLNKERQEMGREH